MLICYDNIIFTQRQISTTLAEMSDLSLLWKLWKTLLSLQWQGCVSVGALSLEEESVINNRNYVILLPWCLVIYNV